MYFKLRKKNNSYFLGTCLNDCNFNGRCDKGDCYCHSEWQGKDCSEVACSLTCVHGTCTDDGRCECNTNFGGANCDTPITTTSSPGKKNFYFIFNLKNNNLLFLPAW